MPDHLQPIDRLDYAVLALEGLNDLVAAAPNLQEVPSEKLSVLIGLVADEIKDCAEELRQGH
ncbi:hypothetical protein MPLA_1190064 [Mesorhizobium sp. ORS 3359]|uniref:hypothetical protein n=1 Tax=Mesorhizobium sp. M2A.F.Ca.ET.015.02.1.1 TaxID=2496758 RepID=UPI0005009FB2|nr:hypothetical protein [Mesorhizobium sp. M2A.F.Ca.ET.015.02.1.1]RUW41496.1 hypothetical protein EOA37_09550 [Mesorhizobium sp. M2A.F.Ca.ET.015.02.1.1]CDX20098.1 hypothetical protein MPLA_1190064 [Mesorhizobium sp. ORS 3359]